MEDDGKFPEPDEEIEHGKGMSRGGRKRRRKGGNAEGELEHHRLDRRPRKAGGGSFRTPSGSVSAAGRHKAEEHGETMPGTDKFPIRNASDLENAKRDIGRTNQPEKARAWINKRARELGKPPLGG